MNTPATGSASGASGDDPEVFDAEGNRIVYRDRLVEVPATVLAAPAAPEYDDDGRRISRMGAGGARSTRGMDATALVRSHWQKGIADDSKWLQLYSACIQRHTGAECDLAQAADEADMAYFEWWQRREASNTGA